MTSQPVAPPPQPAPVPTSSMFAVISRHCSLSRLRPASSRAQLALAAPPTLLAPLRPEAPAVAGPLAPPVTPPSEEAWRLRLSQGQRQEVWGLGGSVAGAEAGGVGFRVQWQMPGLWLGQAEAGVGFVARAGRGRRCGVWGSNGG